MTIVEVSSGYLPGWLRVGGWRPVRRFATESAVYGLVLVAALVAVAGAANWDVIVKVSATVVVFWAVHVYVGMVAHLDDQQDSGVLLPARIKAAARVAVLHSWGMLVVAVLPLAVLLLGHSGLLSEQQAVWACLWLCVALLGVIGYVKVAAWTTILWVRLASGLVIALLGLMLVLLKMWVH